jgi:hypothetical protein
MNFYPGIEMTLISERKKKRVKEEKEGLTLESLKLLLHV